MLQNLPFFFDINVTNLTLETKDYKQANYSMKIENMLMFTDTINQKFNTPYRIIHKQKLTNYIY